LLAFANREPICFSVVKTSGFLSLDAMWDAAPWVCRFIGVGGLEA
jgi:hypothetical protein